MTSIAGPNRGAALADALTGALPPGSVSRSVVSGAVNAFATVIELISGDPGAPQDSSAALDSLSSAGMAAFNAKYPEGLPTTSCGQGPAVVNGVRYYSWSGAQPYTNVFDPIDPALALTSLVYGSAKNDGLVGSCSSHLGTVLRDDYGMNHLDEVNQTAGLVNLFTATAEMQSRDQAFLASVGPELFAVESLQQRNTRMMERMSGLLDRAKAAGVVRDDVTAEDMPFLISAIGGATQACAPAGAIGTSPDLWRRYLGIVLDGLRPAGATPLPTPAPSRTELMELKAAGHKHR